MSAAREARRRQERAKKAAGVALVCREALPLQDAPIGRGPSIDVLVAYVGETLRALAGNGADLTATIAITIGRDHPNFLYGQTVIEAKAAKRKAVDAGEIAVPPADEADLPDTDDESAGGLLATS